jgi:hypothetical protein
MTGETRACHYNGTYQHLFGKGRGIKCDDVASAEFCEDCDKMFYEGMKGYFDTESGEFIEWTSPEQRDAQFLFHITMTNIRRFGE